MAGALPEYYFRVHENGAFVLRTDTENRQRRIEMDQIAVVNIRNGETSHMAVVHCRPKICG